MVDVRGMRAPDQDSARRMTVPSAGMTRIRFTGQHHAVLALRVTALQTHPWNRWSLPAKSQRPSGAPLGNGHGGAGVTDRQHSTTRKTSGIIRRLQEDFGCAIVGRGQQPGNDRLREG